MARRFLPIAFLLAWSLFGCGGGPTITKAQADQVKLGMTTSMVEKILGKGVPIPVPKMSKVNPVPGGPDINIDLQGPANNATWLQWGNDRAYFRVGFKEDKAIITDRKGI